MKVVADLCIVPMGVGPSVSPYVREIKAILDASDLDAEMHANGTNIEGELADICRLIELCEERLADLGVQRVFFTLIFSSRRDKDQTMADKLAAVS
ncbi:MAG: MTH1187 family thiamine-binding protein [Methylobacterium sp.]